VENHNYSLIKGVAAVVENSSEIKEDTIDKLFDGSDANLRILFANRISEAALLYCIKSGIKYLGRDRLYENFHNYFAYKKPNFEKDDIAGMILVCKPDLFTRILERKAESFTYFKGGPTGKYLKSGHRALIYSESTPHHRQTI
jgi:hypothetical protein